ncbi:MAG: hypothetical protein U9R42_11920 [Bacteroidota bacterium]|nr:hypothetical protein [Bacteroidota bacterium]
MKTLKKLLPLFIIAILVIFTSCEKDEEIAQPTPIQSEINDNETLAMNDISLLEEPEISIASLETDFHLINNAIPSETENEIEFDESSCEFSFHGARKNQLKKLFQRLDLNKKQKFYLHKALHSYYRCKRVQMILLRKETLKIIKRSNYSRDKLIKSYKDGNITKNQLYVALQKLQTATKLAIKNNPVRKQIIMNIKDCHKNFMIKLQKILTDKQWAILKKWYQSKSSNQL